MLEQDEVFDVVINGTDTVGVVVGMPRTAEVTIMNTNSKFSIAMYVACFDNAIF